MPTRTTAKTGRSNGATEALRRELAEAHERELAITAVLRVISRSPRNLNGSLQAVADAAVRLCNADSARVYLREGEFTIPGPGARRDGEPITLPNEGQPTPPSGTIPFPGAEAMRTGRTVHYADHHREMDERGAGVAFREFLEKMLQIPGSRDVRTTLSVPLLRDDVVVGVLTLQQFDEVRPFTGREIALAESFADQAVIAIENARLFAELQESNQSLSESLEQQTAIAHVLAIISSAPMDLERVLPVVLARAVDLLDADEGMISRDIAEDSGVWQGLVTHYQRGGVIEQTTAQLNVLRTGHLRTPAVTSRVEQRTVHDLGSLEELQERYPDISAEDWRERRAFVMTPLVRNGAVIGTLRLFRTRPKSFTERQIKLVETFADQAVIAIENARLFDELQATNTTLREALEQQTATSDILRAISNVPGNVTTVFETILESAHKLVGASIGSVFLYRDGLLHCAAGRGHTEARRRFLQTPLAPNPEAGGIGLTIRERRTAAMDDMRDVASPEVYATLYPDGEARSACTVPVLRAGELLGVISFIRTEVSPFTERQIALLETFADQAAIAIENARLFDEIQAKNRELTEALEYQTATAEILEIISQSPTDVQPVLDAIVQRARALAEGDNAVIWRIEGDEQVRWASTRPVSLGLRLPMAHTRFTGLVVRERRTVHTADPGPISEEQRRAWATLFDAPGGTPPGSSVFVPLLREGMVVAVLGVYRTEVCAFTDKQIALLETFADQAVIAVQNARLFDELQRSNATLREALEQQTATADVLHIISSTPTDLRHVLDAVAERAVRLCEADDAAIHRFSDGQLEIVAATNESPLPRTVPSRAAPTAATIPGRALVERRTVHFWGEPEEVAREFPRSVEIARQHDRRTWLCVPLLRDGTPIGLISLRRREARPFSDRHVALAETFADQVAIAIENARLFEDVQTKGRELEDRNAALTESLEHQQATGEVLELISRAPVHVQAVLDGIVERTARLCEATIAFVYFLEDDRLRRVAAHESAGPIGGTLPLDRSWPVGVAALERRTVYFTGEVAEVEQEYTGLGAFMRERGLDERTQLSVPLVQGDAVVGALVAARLDQRGFTPAQIALVETFADQAVIAVQNARLFDELQQSNATLREALERQTATSEVLEILSSAPVDLQRVLDAVAEHAGRLCGTGVLLSRFDGARVWNAANYWDLADTDRHDTTQLENRERSGLRGFDPSRFMGDRAMAERRVIQLVGDAEMVRSTYPGSSLVPEGQQARLAVPLLHRGEPVGSLFLIRTSDVPFSKDDIALVQTFADQAVIAIENARLFDELQARNTEQAEALEREQATADVLRVISRSPEALEAALRAVASAAVRLCRADAGRVYVRDGEYLVAGPSASGGRLAEWQRAGERVGPLADLGHTASAEALRTRRAVHYPDMGESMAAHGAAGQVWSAAVAAGRRTTLAVPLLRGDAAVGVLVLARGPEPRPFTDGEIALAETFADQAVIAIENARLFDALKHKSEELEVAGRAKDDFLSRMSHELRTPMNAILGFAEILAMDPQSTTEQREWVGQILGGGRHLLGLINEVLDIARIEAGQLSLSPEPVAVADVLAEVLDLARPLAAERTVALSADDAPDLSVQADRQRLRQVLLNLATNAIKYNRPGGSVTLSVSDEERGTRNEGRATSNEGGAVSSEPRATGADVGDEANSSLLAARCSLLRLTVRDTGPGIPPEKLDRLFVPFDRLGAEQGRVEGTGLGLAIAKRLVEAMGGAIGVESIVDEGSAFWVELPRATALAGVDPALYALPAAQPDAPETVATLLYVEDNPANLKLVEQVLRFRPGIALLTATDGRAGLELARARRPDLILLDLNLPELTGAEVLAALRDDPATRAIPVVVISADATEGQRRRLLAAGAHDYLTKPLQLQRLLDLLDALLSPAGAP